MDQHTPEDNINSTSDHWLSKGQFSQLIQKGLEKIVIGKSNLFSHVFQIQWRALDEINAGVCDGMTYDEIKKSKPEEYEYVNSLTSYHLFKKFLPRLTENFSQTFLLQLVNFVGDVVHYLLLQMFSRSSHSIHFMSVFLLRSRKKDKLRYRYPRGESYLDVIQRLIWAI